MRHFGKPLLDVFDKYRKLAPDRRLLHAQIRLLLKKSVELEVIIDDNKEFYRWPTPVCEQFLQSTFDLLELQRAVSNFFHNQEPAIALFHTTIKSHMQLHVALYSFGINPIMVWNFMGEDFMKRMKTLAQQNTSATPWLKVNAKMVDQYCRGMDFFLLDGNCEFFR